MQKCSVLVALGGDVTMTVRKNDVTVPEAIVLMAANGREAVSRLPGTLDESNVIHKEEYARLSHVYGAEVVKGVFGSTGFNITFPTRFSEIGLDDTTDLPAPVPAAAEEAPAAEPEPAPKEKRADLKLK